MYTNPVPSETMGQPQTVVDVLEGYLYWPYLLVAGFVIFLVILVVIEVRDRVKDHQEEVKYTSHDSDQEKSSAHEYRMPSGGWPNPGGNS